MAKALVEVSLASTEEKVALLLKSGETAELTIVNKDPWHVVCEVAVKRLRGLQNSLVAVELGGERLYLGRSSGVGGRLSAEIEPGGAKILQVRFIAPPNVHDTAHAELEVRLRSLHAVAAGGEKVLARKTTPKPLPALVHEKP